MEPVLQSMALLLAQKTLNVVANIVAGAVVDVCGGMTMERILKIWVNCYILANNFWFFLVCVAIKCELCRDIRKSVL